MSKFYFQLWFGWVLRVTVSSVVMASLVSMMITLFLYIKKGTVALNLEVIQALLEVFIFWFPLVWSVTLLVSLFRSLKYIFNTCRAGYELKLLECNKSSVIEVIGYGDLVKVWRRWFMMIIWLTAAQMVLALGFTSIFTSYNAIFEWFNIYVLFLFILCSGYVSFILLAGRCKKVKLIKC